ncbi:hypothetical protein [Sorangium sp. So ce1024]|uniref:hypothetical protein n=1 Tax=Sorangium sp. So ce1024 TaxID=3133327 RepID=UPI003F0BAF46
MSVLRPGFRRRRKAAAPAAGAAGAAAPGKKPKPPAKPFDIVAAWATARATLSVPPTHPRVQRREPEGRFVAGWVLPLDMVPGVNSLNGRTGWQKGAARDRVRKEMLRQSSQQRPDAPLAGRPFVRVIRFSSVEPDGDQAFSKLPVDALLVDKPKRPKGMPKEMWEQIRRSVKPNPKKLGYLVDDKPACIDLFVSWEPAPPGRGCVLVEVWTGRGA